MSCGIRLGEEFLARRRCPWRTRVLGEEELRLGLVAADVLHKVLEAVFIHVGTEPVVEEIHDLTAGTLAVLDPISYQEPVSTPRSLPEG